MKTRTPLLIVAALAVAGTLRAQVAVPIDPVTVSQPVTVTQNVTVTAVPLTAIRFDVIAQRIDFTVSLPGGGNRTITLTGAEYTAVRDRFFHPFSQAVAPTLRAKLSASGD